jgi:hypothetical protein
MTGSCYPEIPTRQPGPQGPGYFCAVGAASAAISFDFQKFDLKNQRIFNLKKR